VKHRVLKSFSIWNFESICLGSSLKLNGIKIFNESD
jgi:hypothetical protein